MYRRLIILISIVIIILSAFCFRFTKGWVSDMSSTVFLDYLNAYPSSLPDNNAVIDFFVFLFTPALIIEVIRFRVKMKFSEYLFHLMILALQCILVYSIILDADRYGRRFYMGKIYRYFLFLPEQLCMSYLLILFIMYGEMKNEEEVLFFLQPFY